MAKSSLILASGSAARRAMLAAAGLVIDVVPANLDEGKIVADLQQKLPPAEIAAALAREKALSVAGNNPQALVIGADQILTCDNKLYSKAVDSAEARQKLRSLSGKTHNLISAVCVVRGDDVVWAHTDSAALTMRFLSDDEIADYMAGAGKALTRSVGAYELEGLGAWLFDKVEGDYYTILGMPLLPLLQFLRQSGFKPDRAAA